jgi:hypothetical protein
MFKKVSIIESDRFDNPTGYSRVFVQDKEDIDLVLSILMKHDQYEFDTYLSNNLKHKYITVWKENDINELVYSYKFCIDDVDKFIKKCKNVGAEILVKFKPTHEVEETGNFYV